MLPRDVAMALAVVVIWGTNFVVIAGGLEHFPPLLFAALRFALVAFPAVLFIRPPDLPVQRIVAVGLFLWVGQFGCLFVAMHHGMPAGTASVLLQAQAPLTVIFAAVRLRERPRPLQIVGLVIASAGLATLATAAQAVPAVATVLVLVAGACWAAGNVATREAATDRPFALLIYSAAVAPLPLVGLSVLIEGPQQDWAALRGLDGAGLSALAYVVTAATIIGFGSWYWLLSRYPATSVAPFTLLVPIVGLTAAWLVLSEHPTARELAGAIVTILGTAVLIAAARSPARVPSPIR